MHWVMYVKQNIDKYLSDRTPAVRPPVLPLVF
jgi:hypothetical protein